MRMLVIVPVSVPDYNAAVLAQVAGHAQGHAVDVECLPGGPRFIDSVANELAAAAHVRARLARLDGYDAVLVDCFGDPGVDEVGTIPITGAFVPAMHAAQRFGQPISIILPNSELAAHIRERVDSRGWIATTYGLLAPTREHVFACARAIAAADGRQTILLGCTAWAAFADELRAELAADIVEPEQAAIADLVDRLEPP